MRVRIRSKRQVEMLAGGLSRLIRLLGRTMKVDLVNAEHVVRRLEARQGQILCTWHGRTLIPVWMLRDRGAYVLTSPSNDGEYMARFAKDLGLKPIRGSSGRFASRSALASVRALMDGGSIAMAPDGPKGPPGIAQPGVLYFAMKSGAPIVPVGVAAHPAWFAPTWDSFMVPKPRSRGVMIVGEPMYVPADAGEADLPGFTARLREDIDRLQREAEVHVGARPPAVAGV